MTEPHSAIWDKTQAVWEGFRAGADEAGIFHGSITGVFDEVNARPWYSHIMRCLKGMERIRVLHSARGAASPYGGKENVSVVELFAPEQPLSVESFFRVWNEIKTSKSMKKQNELAFLDQRIRDLADQFVTLSVRVDALEGNRTPEVFQESGEGPSRERIREVLNLESEGNW